MKQQVKFVSDLEVKKVVRDEGLRQKAKELAMKDAQKADIQETSEGRSFLRYRFEYWMKKLSI